MIKLYHKGKYTDEDIAYLVAQLRIITGFGICDSTVANCPECRHRSACLDLSQFIGYVEKLQIDVDMRNRELISIEFSDFVK